MDSLHGEADRAVTLATVRGLRGYHKAFALLSEHIANCAGGPTLPLTDLPKTLFPGASSYRSKPDIGMEPDESAFRAACDLIRAHFAVARQNEAGTIADHDTEFLHEYRVALRRVRSVLSLFKGVYDEARTTELKARFSALMAETGRLRDLDVYLLERERYLSLVPESARSGLDRMFAILAEERNAEQTRLARYLKSPAYHREAEALMALFADPEGTLAKGPMAETHALAYARRLIWKRYRKVCRIAAGIGADTPDEQVHELRIQCKKLRYLMEFFAPLFDKSTVKPLIKALKKLQDNLGAFNDYSVQQAALEDLLNRMPEGPDVPRLEIAKGVGALIAELNRQQCAERARVVDSFSAFDAPATREGFTTLFKRREVST